MRYSRSTLVPILLSVAGCAASSGILPAGPNTYIVTERFAPIRGGSAEGLAQNSEFLAGPLLA